MAVKLRDILLGSTVAVAALATIAASPLSPNEFTTAASIRALPGGQFNVVHRYGYSQYGDGGEADYYWSATSTCADDGGTCLAPAGGGTGRLVLRKNATIRPEMFGAKGFLLPPLIGNGIATTSGSATFSNVTVPTSYIGQPVRISGVGPGGNVFDSTIASATTFTSNPSVTQSTGSPTYFLTDFVIGTPNSAGCSAAAVVTAPAPTNGTVTGGFNAQITIDTVSSGVFATGHVSQAGVYTASNAFGNLVSTLFTGGGCGTNITVAAGLDKAGSYVIGPDDTAPWQAVAAAVLNGYRNVEAMPGAVYQVRATIAPGGPAGSSSVSNLINIYGAPISANLYGATFVNSSWHNTDNGWSFLFNAGGADHGSIRGFDFVQWPYPHRVDNHYIDHPTGTWGIVLNGPATDWLLEDAKCRGGVVGVHILGAVGGQVYSPRNVRPIADGCIYGATVTLATNPIIESLQTQNPCRSLFIRSVTNAKIDATARSAYCNTVLIENVDASNHTNGLNLNYHVLPRLAGGTFTGTTTINSKDLTLVTTPDGAPFLWGLSGIGIPTGTVGMYRDGNKIRMSQAATASGAVTVTVTAMPNMYSFANSEITIAGIIANAKYSNLKINIDYDGTGYQSGLAPLLFTVNGFGAASSATFIDTVQISGKAKNLPAGTANACSPTGSNWDTNCLFNIGDHASAPWTTSQIYNFVIRDFAVVDNIGATPGGIHMDGNIVASPTLSPAKFDNVILPAASAFTVDNDTINRSWDWPGRVFTFTPIWKFGGASVGQTYSTQQGTWMRNGKQTTLNIRTTMTAKGSSTGTAALAVPAPPSSTNTSTIASNCSWINGMAAGVGVLASVPGASPDFGFAVGPGTGGITATLADTHFTNTSDLGCTFNYASQ